MKKIYAFTLAEVLITLTILGVVAALTVPSLVQKNQYRINKTRVKKAMSVYEKALNSMVIENNLSSDSMVKSWTDEVNNCANTTRYFKKASGDGCLFKTADGIWWNIEDILRPVIYFKKDGITEDNRDRITAKANDPNDYEAFVLVGRFDDNLGALRVDDLAFEQNNPLINNGYNSYNQVAKLYNFINGINGPEEDDRITNPRKYLDQLIARYPQCQGRNNGPACISYHMVNYSEFEYNGYKLNIESYGFYNNIYDENRNIIGSYYDSPDNNHYRFVLKYDDGLIYGESVDRSGLKHISIVNPDGSFKESYQNCEVGGKNCEPTNYEITISADRKTREEFEYDYDGGGRYMSYHTTENLDDGTCYYTYYSSSSDKTGTNHPCSE